MKRFTDSFRWKLSLYAAFIACAVYLPAILMNSDPGETDYWLAILIAAPVSLLAAFALLFTRARKTALSVFAAMVAALGVSLTLLFFSHDIRTAERWGFHSSRYKQEVLALAAPAPGDYRHIEWDGWGMAGSDTIQYLVYDPQDKIRVPGKSAIFVNGASCDVWRVRRLERNWYLVTFFTNNAWNDC